MRKWNACTPAPSVRALSGGICTITGTQRASVGPSSTSAAAGRVAPGKPATPIAMRSGCSVAFISCTPIDVLDPAGADLARSAPRSRRRRPGTAAATKG